MTAGRGIVHEEEIGAEDPEAEGEFEGFQIWVNLPARYKYIESGFKAFSAEELPDIELEGGSLRVIAGTYGEEVSPVDSYSPLFLYHADLDVGSELIIPAPSSFEVGIYTAEGTVLLEEQTLSPHQLAIYPTQEGQVKLFASEPARLMIMGGEPLAEPMASYGPFVMNTMDEIREVMDAYQRGEFGSL